MNAPLSGSPEQVGSRAESGLAAAQLDLFDRRGWWAPGSPKFAALRDLSAIRLGILRRWLARFARNVRGQVVVDLGAGGGLMGVPLARMGARCVCIDIAQQPLLEAFEQSGRAVSVCRADLYEAPLADGCADLVLLCDVVEHVADPARAVAEACRLLAPDGFLFVNTINRSWWSGLLAVTVAEGLCLIPKGTHDPRRFVRPKELEAMAAAAGLRLRAVSGEGVRLLQTLWSRRLRFRQCRSLALGYSAIFQKGAR